MKTNFLNFSKLSIALLLLFTACNKSGDSQNDQGSFTWAWNATNYTANYKEAVRQSLSGNPLIIGGTGNVAYSAGSGPRITVNSLTTGTYTLGGGVTNTLSFIAPNGDNFGSTMGTLTITQNSNNKLSGNFSATITDGISQTGLLTGSFSNITISY